MGLGLGLAGGLAAAAASRPAAPEPMYTPKQEPSYAYNPPPPEPAPPPPPPPPPPAPVSAPVPPPPPITEPPPQPAPIFEPPQPPQPPMQPRQEYEFMQNGFNVDDTPAYIQVPKGAAGNAAVQLPPEPVYTPPPAARDRFIPQTEMEGMGGEPFAPPVYTPPLAAPPEPVYTPPSEPAYQAPAYTAPSAQNFFEEQNQGTFQFDGTGGFGRYGGLDRDDRYYEQMFSKGGIAKLLYRR